MKFLISFTGECAMKKTISLFFGLLLLPTGLYAGESSLIFNDSSSFQIVRSLKLGHAMGEMENPTKAELKKAVYANRTPIVHPAKNVKIMPA